MQKRCNLFGLVFVIALLVLQFPSQGIAAKKTKPIRVGIIGLDSSHAVAFTKLLNDPDAPPELSGCKVVAAYPKGSPDIVSSTSRVEKYTKTVKEYGVEIVESIPKLIEKVDVILLETNDGRPHLEQVLPVLKAGKPVFVDKPVAASLVDVIAIFDAAKKYKTPIYSSSKHRYMETIKAVQAGAIGKVTGCTSYVPCPIEKTHPDFFWYGIHGVEIAYSVLGTGCDSVIRIHTPDTDVIVGTWQDGKLGTVRGRRRENNGYIPGFGGLALGTKGTKELVAFRGFKPIVVEIVKFFKTGKPPVSAETTIEIYAFMEAAEESKRRGGARVTLKEVMRKARVKTAKNSSPVNIRRWILKLNKSAIPMPKIYTQVQEENLLNEYREKILKEMGSTSVELLWKVKEVRWYKGMANLTLAGPKNFLTNSRDFSLGANPKFGFIMTKEEASKIKVGQILKMTANVRFKKLHPRLVLTGPRNCQHLFFLYQKYHYSNTKQSKSTKLGTFTTTDYECFLGEKELFGQWKEKENLTN